MNHGENVRESCSTQLYVVVSTAACPSQHAHPRIRMIVLISVYLSEIGLLPGEQGSPMTGYVEQWREMEL